MEDGEMKMAITIIVMENLILNLKMLKFYQIMKVVKMIITQPMIMMNMNLKEMMMKKNMLHHLSILGK